MNGLGVYHRLAVCPHMISIIMNSTVGRDKTCFYTLFKAGKWDGNQYDPAANEKHACNDNGY